MALGEASVAGAPAAGRVQITAKDLLLACAKDSTLFARTWFPSTVRQRPAVGHEEIWKALESQSARFVNLEAARGFAKTTIARIYTAKRIAYSTARTMLYVGASDDHARRSIMWLRGKLAQQDPSTGSWLPTKFASFYGLRKGAKWNESELEVYHGIDQRPIWVLGVGITGNIRGINFDDYRPDFIYCDDILTDENTATKEQREKIFDLVFGALKESLAPPIDEPNAKMVLGQTPHDLDDVCQRAKKSHEFTTVSLPCWTKETLDSPVESQESAWPDRIPSSTLRAEKIESIASNRYSIFAREKECRLITRETAAFKPEWVRVYSAPPEAMYSVLAIDPVPPPSEREKARALAGKDFECQMVIGRFKGEYWVRACIANQGHEPNWSVNTALQLAREYRVGKIIVEAVAYQSVLKYMLEVEMKRRGMYFQVEAYKDHRKKYNRITSSIAGPLSQGKLHVGEAMHELRRQIEMYPSIEHDDYLDALSIGLSGLVNPYLEAESFDAEEEYGAVDFKRACP